jgi:hypothetical protein
MDILGSDSAQFSEESKYFFREPQPARARGRPLLLDEPNLHNRRTRLVQVFEGYWGEIGQMLHKCRKPDDLVTVFRTLRGKIWDGEISTLYTPSSEPGTGAALRKIRSERRALVKPMHLASEAKQRAHQRLERARSALGQKGKRSERKAVRKEFVTRWNESRRADERDKSLNERDNSLLAQLKLSEASFTRRELFRFLKSRRYELTPLNLANAAAGLPYMGWRQSMRRCFNEKCISADGIHYQVFKAIRYMISTTKAKTTQQLVTHFQKSVPLLPSRFRLAKIDMAAKWLYLERALRTVCRAKPYPKAIPFEVTKQYFRQMHIQSHTDVLLAERGELTI